MSTVVETLRDKVKAEVDALKIVMATGYDPTFSYTYDRHPVANLLLNAVTVDVLPAAGGDPIGPDIPSTNSIYDLTVSVRVHTGYRHSPMLEVVNTQMLDSLDNYLNEQRNLGDGYRLIMTFDINPRMEFSESATKGGELKMLIKIPMERLQA